MAELTTREWDPARDRAAVRACFVEFQEFERRIDPAVPPEGAVVGFATIYRRFRSDEPDHDPREHGGAEALYTAEGFTGWEIVLQKPLA